MTRDQVIQQSENYIQWLDRRIDCLEVKADLRSRLAVGCLDTALEHQKAIVLLVAKQLHGSAFALVRSIFEAYVRGIWLHRCAEEADLEKFVKGHIPKFSMLLDAIERLDGFENGVLSVAKDHSWKIMNSFTHTGFDQIVRRHTENTIEPNYDEEEILEVVNFANAIGSLAAIAICELAGNVELANSLLEKIKKVWPSES